MRRHGYANACDYSQASGLDASHIKREAPPGSCVDRVSAAYGTAMTYADTCQPTTARHLHYVYDVIQQEDEALEHEHLPKAWRVIGLTLLTSCLIGTVVGAIIAATGRALGLGRSLPHGYSGPS